MGWLDGTVALVTGGGSGLGHAVVTRYVAEGARVGVLEVSPEKARALAGKFGDQVHVVVGDATSYLDNEQAVAEVVDLFGRLDAFVGNAALWDFNTSIEALPAEAASEAFDEVFGLNVKGCLLGAKATVAALRETRGSMIFTLSSAAFHPGGGGPIYTASKHALVGLVKQLAYELAPDVRVNGVAPGGMSTDLRGPRALGLDQLPWSSLPVDRIIEGYSPLARPIMPDDYTGHYVLLASPENSRTVTGAIHVCDGGIAVRGRREQEAAMTQMGLGR